MTNEEIKAAFEDIQPFVRFDAQGRIIGEGTQGRRFTELRADAGELIILGHGARSTHFVDRENDDAIVERPMLGAFSRTQMRAGEGATLDDLPACTVSWTGPISGSEEHPGGPYEIGWTVSGTYTLTIDAWPYQAVEITFTIES